MASGFAEDDDTPSGIDRILAQNSCEMLTQIVFVWHFVSPYTLNVLKR
jgi:hypothetical protein